MYRIEVPCVGSVASYMWVCIHVHVCAWAWPRGWPVDKRERMCLGLNTHIDTVTCL